LNDLAKPFLRWAGGKTWLLKHLKDQKLEYSNYHEPFLGGAAIYLFLRPPRKSYLSDLNPELVHTYCALQGDVEKVIRELKKFNNTESDYYKIRQTNFRNDFRRAAKFIFLNQASFNGIYRVNLAGKYNVPYGFRNVPIFNAENLIQISNQLKKARIFSDDFTVVSKNVKENDLVFLDPPYTVTHNNNGFVKYNQKLFSLADQYRLSDLIDDIKAKKAFYILTNAAHKKIEEIFEKGDEKIALSRASLIGGLHATRGQFEELLFTNIHLSK
jgi:DNA adenine methylase